MKSRVTCLLLLLLLLSPARAEVYKWVDENGRVHYGDKPSGKNAEEASEVEIKRHSRQPPPASRIEDTRKVLRSLEEARLERQRALREKREGKAEKRERRKKCNEMINDLLDRERGGTMWYTLDDDGEREYWDAARLEKENAELREKIVKHCGKKALEEKAKR